MHSTVSTVNLGSHLRKGVGSYAILLALVAEVLRAGAQSSALSPDLTASFKSGEWLIKTWENQDGLPENSATAMVQTPDGYLWFGTFNGLVRFDGVRFTVFDRSNTPELPSAMIVNLHLDRQVRLWVSTDRGILFLKGGKWSAVFGPEQGWTGDYARTFAEGAGKLFLTSFNGKVFQFDGQQFKELPEPPGAKERGYFGHVDRQGRFWVAQHNFIGTWDGELWHETLLADQFMSEDGGAGPARDGGLWLFNRRQLSKLEAGKITKQIELESITPGGFWSLTEDSLGDVWIATYNSGLLRASPAGKLAHITTTNGLSHVSVRFVFEDREGNYWVGTSGGGLMRFKRRAFFTFDQTHGLPEQIIRSVAITRSNEVLVGVYGGGLMRFANNGMTRVELPPPLNIHSYVQCVLEDSRERIWVGTFQQGLALLEGQNARPIPKEESAGNVINALFEDSRQRVWIAGNHGVSVCEGGQFQVYRTGAGHPLDGVETFAEEPGTGAVWLGDSYQRLHRFQDGAFQETVPSGDTIDAPIRSLVAEGDGTLWVGTAGAGLGRLRNGRFVRVTKAQSHPAKRIGSMLLDDTGHFWFGTEQGLIRSSRAELIEVADGARRQADCQIFDQKDHGLLTTEFSTTSQPGSVRDQTRRLWFGTVKGLSVVDLGRLRTDSNPPPVHIERVNFTDHDGKSRSVEPTNSSLVLPAGSRAVEIQFTALGFAAPSNVKFAIRLTRDGQEITSTTGDRRVAVFDWLAPANYKFHVAAANHHGTWNRAGATLNFSVLPFYWQTNWFRVLVALGLVFGTTATVWRALHNRHRRAEEKLEEHKRTEKVFIEEHMRRLQAEREARAMSQRLLTAHEMERSRVARELHDDVTQRLARLAIDAAQAERGVPIVSDDGTSRSMREELVRLSEDVHSLAYRLHPSILEELGLVEAIRAECDRVSRRDSIRADVVRSSDVPREIPREVALCLFRIAQESLRNVARHAHADAVQVSLIGMDGGLQLAVRDNGIGFDPARNRGEPSLGHASMRERINLVEGELDIESAPSHGTAVVAWVPLNRAMKS